MDMKGLQQRASAARNTPNCNVHYTYRSRVPRSSPPSRHLHLARCRAANGLHGTAQPAQTDVEHILRQHKALMESGFSYDQASLILQVTQRRRASNTCAGLPALQDASVNSTAAEQSPVALDIRSSDSPGDISPLPAPDQQQQQQYLKTVEDRLSFLEMELLKQAVTASTQQESPQLSSSNAATTASGKGNLYNQPATGMGAAMPPTMAAADAGFDSDAWGAEVFQSSLPGKAELLDPEVLAIAQALLIRKGLPYSVDAFASSSSSSSSSSSNYYRRHHYQQQQQQNTSRIPSTIWGRRAAMRQLRAKPWRYKDPERDDYGPVPPTRRGPSDRAVMQGSFLPYGYQPNFDASMIRSGRGSSSNRQAGGVPEEWLMSHEGLELEDTDLAPYEPSGWAVAGTILVVYAGILLTFFAVLAGTADGSGSIDPTDLAMMMW